MRANKVNLSERLRARRARRGLAHRRPHRPVRAGEPREPRGRSGPASCCSTAPRSTRSWAGPSRRARRSCPLRLYIIAARPGQDRARAGARQEPPRQAARHRRPRGQARRRPRGRRRAARPVGPSDRRALGRRGMRLDADDPGGRRCTPAASPGRVIVGGVAGRPGRVDVRQDDLAAGDTATTCACGCCASRAATRPRTATSILPSTHPEAAGRLRDHGAGRVPGDVAARTRSAS